MTEPLSHSGTRAVPKPLPKFLDLSAIRFPIGAIASIGHRISGVVLLIALPLLARTLEVSLRSEADYERLLAASSPLRALALVVLIWAAAHHVLAGLRHLLMDVGVGVQLKTARRSAWVVIAAAALLAAYAAARAFL